MTTACPLLTQAAETHGSAAPAQTFSRETFDAGGLCTSLTTGTIEGKPRPSPGTPILPLIVIFSPLRSSRQGAHRRSNLAREPPRGWRATRRREGCQKLADGSVARVLPDADWHPDKGSRFPWPVSLAAEASCLPRQKRQRLVLAIIVIDDKTVVNSLK